MAFREESPREVEVYATLERVVLQLVKTLVGSQYLWNLSKNLYSMSKICVDEGGGVQPPKKLSTFNRKNFYRIFLTN